MRKFHIGILTSKHVPCILELNTLRAAAREAGRQLGRLIECIPIDADDLHEPPTTDLLIQGLGRAYPDAGWGTIASYFKHGGHLLTLGAQPCTHPYRVVDDKALPGERTDAALHALELIDACVPSGAFERPRARDVSPRFDFLADIPLPPMRETCSLAWRLATKPASGDLYSTRGLQEADLDVACRLYSDDERPLAAPIVRVDHYEGGALTCVNFDPEPTDYWSGEDGRALLTQLLAVSLGERWTLSLGVNLARLYPGEEAEVHYEARCLSGFEESTPRRVILTLTPADDVARVIDNQVKRFQTNNVEGMLRDNRDQEGCFVVQAQLEIGGRVLQTRRNGYYRLSDAGTRALAARAPGLSLDAAVAPDYCLHGGVPFPMTGSTYFVRDVFRDCFAGANVAIARSDLATLRQAGVNILRTGVWTAYERVYHPDGGFQEGTLRSLDAYFLAAAEAGLPVQFAPAAFVMNHWDRDADMFHNPALRAKIMRTFEQFARRYAEWPGVQLDIINEPSYAPYRDGCLWQHGRATGDPGELVAWHDWLRARHDNDAGALRAAWGVSAAEVPDFEQAALPQGSDYETNYDGPPHYDRRAVLADFYAFADDAFAHWTGEIRDIVRRAAPRMPVMLGRDETLRVPSQQRDAMEGHIDFVNWHQWHREGVMFNEYCLNRVPGLPCVGQEMGVLPYKDQRNDERLNEHDVRNHLERKLLYCLGNWIQWQSYCDPTMDNYKETRLGLFHADGCERAAMNTIRQLARLEASMASRLVGRREADEQLAIVVPTSLWFSSDYQMAYHAVMRAVHATHLHLKRPAYLILENLLCERNARQIGRPKLLILPSPTVLSQPAWRYLLGLVEQGATLLVSGCFQQDPYWRRTDRLSDLGLECETSNLATIERVRLDEQDHDLTFQEVMRLGLPGKGLLRAVPGNATPAEPVVVPQGKGKVVYCPMPLELAEEIAPTVAFYRPWLERALDEPLIRPEPESRTAAHFIYPIAYRDMTAVTLVNEGVDDTFRFRLTQSDTLVEAFVAAGRGAKLYIDTGGKLLGAYHHGPLVVGEQAFTPEGDHCASR